MDGARKPLSESDRDALVSLLRSEDPDLAGTLVENLVAMPPAEFENIRVRFDPREAPLPAVVLRAIKRRAMDCFVDCAKRSDDPDLEAGLIELSRWGCPELADVEISKVLDDYARRIENRLAPGERTMAVVCRVLFDELGFHGNRREFYDPLNSFLNAVIQRRKGIPITLSCLLILVARRLGRTAIPIGSPGYFLVEAELQGDPCYVDCFGGGRILSRRQAMAILPAVETGTGAHVSEPLPRVDTREVLSRTLRNLYHIYQSNGEQDRVRETVEMLKALG